MLKFKYNLCSLTLFILIQSSAISAENKDFEVSGFARLVAGIASGDPIPLHRYDNQLQLDQESLVAIQIDGRLTDKISATGQFLYHPADYRESGVEWAYLTYHHNQKLNFTLGKLRTPFFQYSDVIDVGLAYPWITPPGQVYREYMFSTFEGAKVSYNFADDQLAYNLEGYWGRFDDDLSINQEKAGATVDDLRGIVFNVVDDKFSYRVSYHTGFVELDIPLIDSLATTLSQLGFDNSAKSLSTLGAIEFIQAGVTYDSLRYFARMEFMKITGDSPLMPYSTGGYATVGYYFHPFTAHFSIASNNSDSASPINELPSGHTPQLDQLKFAYKDIINTFNNADIDTDSITLGIRWDWQANMALKLDFSVFESKPPASMNLSTTPSNNKKTNLIQVGIEWVF